MDAFLVVTAFVLGFLARQIGLPPLVGFLAAGFILNYFGFTVTETLEHLAEIGILLLLFSIGLKVQVKKLFAPQIWATASIHMLITVVLFGTVIFALSLVGIGYFAGLDLSAALLIAFALSFSSTVFAVKILEEKGEVASKHGRLAIGILIMQDLFAVIFITISKGEMPSPFALCLFGLLLLRKPLLFILDRCGHGELVVLLACILPLAGANLFEIVGLKPDLGALLLGMLLAGHPKTDELGKAMFGFKDLFLVGFFLTIGMAELPEGAMFWTAALLVLLVPFKVGLFYLLLTRFALRARTSLLTSLSLANYSEFGLIVGAIGVKSGWLDSHWLVIIAVALSISMIAASPVVTFATGIYARTHHFLRRLEISRRLPEDAPLDLGDASVVVFGMGRVGTGVFDNLQQRYGRMVVGVDSDEDCVEQHLQQGRRVILGDASDYDFWQREVSSYEKIELVFLTMSHSANMSAIKDNSGRIRDFVLAVIAKYDDEKVELKEIGVDNVFNIYEEAGAGFSDHVCQLLEDNRDLHQGQGSGV